MVRPNPGNVLCCTAPLTPAPDLNKKHAPIATNRSMLLRFEGIAQEEVVRVPDFSMTF
jgi:hypothetical protein